MVGMDYLDEGNSRDNLLINPYQAIAFDAAAGLTGRGLRKLGKKYGQQASDVPEVVIDTSRHASSRAVNRGGGQDFRYSKKITARNALVDKLDTKSNYFINHGAKFSKLGWRFGYVGLGVLGFDLFSAAAKASNIFETTREDITAKAHSEAMNAQDVYFDTRAAYTQRQRSLQVIFNSRQNMKPAFGNESSHLHF